MLRKLKDGIKSPRLRPLTAIVPAIIVFIVTLYMYFNRPTDAGTLAYPLPGPPLAAFEALYPVRVDGNTGGLSLDLPKFVKAIYEIEQQKSPRAAAELVYFGRANNILLLLNEKEKRQYGVLEKKYFYSESDTRENLYLLSYRDIVNGLGRTFAGTGIEVVLHDFRNPLKSVLAIQNPISGSRIGDPMSSFSLMLVKNYSAVDFQQPNMVSYAIKLKDGRDVKASTLPIYDPVYGLIAAISVNIDISKLDPKVNADAVEQFLSAFRTVDEKDLVGKMDEIANPSKPNR